MLVSTAVSVLALAGQLSALPVSQPATQALEIVGRQNVNTPVVNITDLGLADIDIIPEAFLEGDNDAGGETNDGGTAVSNANGYVPGGSVGSGQSAQNPNGVEGTSAACSLFGCATSGAAANNQSTTSSSASSGVINGGLINGGLINGGLINLNSPKRWIRRFFFH